MNKSLTGSCLDFVPQEGITVEARTEDWARWLQQRRNATVWSYSRVMSSSPKSTTIVANERNQGAKHYTNFGSQDYLSLSGHPRIKEAANAAVAEYGVHSAGSAILAGRTNVMLSLEQKLSELLNKPACIIYPTGWAAGFGVIAGLAREQDLIVIDHLAHNCLVEGSRHTRAQLSYFGHNDVDELRQILASERERHPTKGIFLVLESLYSMDSDSPDLKECIELARQFGAMTILDVAHDLGAMGHSGRGLLDSVSNEFWPDMIMGSFSKTFASNGGFVAASSSVVDYLRCYSPSFTFSNALSPVQTRIVLECIELIYSAEGQVMREKLFANILRLRDGMMGKGFTVGGTPSPIIPVFIGNESKARLTAKHLEELALLANLVEFPAVPIGRARFRFQMMCNHTDEMIDSAIDLFAQAHTRAKVELESLTRQ